jgi:hypothetical protein
MGRDKSLFEELIEISMIALLIIIMAVIVKFYNFGIFNGNLFFSLIK